MDNRPAYLQGRGRGRGRGNVASDVGHAAPTAVGSIAKSAVVNGGRGRGRGGDQRYNYTSAARKIPVNEEDEQKLAEKRFMDASEKFQEAAKKHAIAEGSANSSDDEDEDDIEDTVLQSVFKSYSRTTVPVNEEDEQKLAKKRFMEASEKFQEVAKMHAIAEDSANSSDDEDEDDIEDTVLQSVFKSYSRTTDTDDGELNIEKAQDDLLHNFRSSTAACLICIEVIKKEDAVWNCDGCCCMFHMQCIQKWVKEGVNQQVYQGGDNLIGKDLPWFCPKCRYEYKRSQYPTRYTCFCRKLPNPKFDPWLVPHSCGQLCGKLLKPDCGHECLLLCHPGPCPSCPQNVQRGCYCGKHGPVTRRCIAQEWSCAKPCGRTLACGHHRCDNPCHAGDCRPCKKTSVQSCLCGQQEDSRPCATPQWQCEQVCGKVLSCASHTCEQVCHPGNCGDCPRGGTRTCPCGKTTYQLPCTMDIPTCPDTCGKPLECGQHGCSQRCHAGPCGACREVLIKRCRCGSKQKELPCHKEYLCESKCSRLRDCTKHQCRRKCCVGDCPPCEQQCNKPLGCHNHKCASRCHPGLCYPCPLTVEITCRCKATSITVPCGKEKTTKPPRCHHNCSIPSNCHHPKRLRHRCHFGECPPCQQICEKSLVNCDHFCTRKCHSAVKVKLQDKVIRAGPWEPLPPVRIEIVNKPCPPCKVPILTHCIGNHERSSLPCSELRPYSCVRQCGRSLECGNHTCALPCHSVTDAPNIDQAGSTCASCDIPCDKPRPKGCTHKCLLPCHPDECPPCTQMNRMNCHCQLSLKHVECFQWNSATKAELEVLKSCKGSCPKILTCGHPCTKLCHSGSCPKAKLCEKKVTLRCECRRKKQDVICKDVQTKPIVIECDAICKSQKEKKKQAEMELDKSKSKNEINRQKSEAEAFERKMKGKRRRQRKRSETIVEVSVWEKYKKSVIIVFLIAVVLSFSAYLIQITEPVIEPVIPGENVQK